MARFPEKPTEDQQEALRSYIHLFARLYPWYDFPLSYFRYSPDPHTIPVSHGHAITYCLRNIETV